MLPFGPTVLCQLGIAPDRHGAPPVLAAFAWPSALEEYHPFGGPGGSATKVMSFWNDMVAVTRSDANIWVSCDVVWSP